MNILKSLFLTLAIAFVSISCYSQYYFRGELKNEQGVGLQGATVFLFSTGKYPYTTGSDGVFGFPSKLKTDTVTFVMEGYDTLRLATATTQFGKFVMKPAHKKNIISIHLSSYTKDFPYSSIDPSDETDKNRSSFIENAFVNASNYKETDLGLHVDKSSYANVKRLLNNREMVSGDEVRIEEMLNYFNIKTREADRSKTFTFNSQITSCPWNEQSRLLFVNLIASKINLDKTPPANLVFLIDVSGSMDNIHKLPLIKDAFKLLTENLRPIDKVSIITYGDAVTELITAVTGAEKKRIIESIEGLRPNGFTPGASAIHTAYTKARENFIPNGNNRIILASDGDFNVGETNTKGLQELASRESKNGIYLSCLGVGIDKDELLEALAKAGKGSFAYLDNEMDAEKVLVEEFAQTSYAVAKDVYLNVQFNKSQVKQYRLIGFDNKRTTINAKITDLIGGDAGSGQSLMAAFEIIRSGTADAPVANMQLSYQLPDKAGVIKEQYEAIQNYKDLEKLDTTYRFAASVIAFGQLLQQTDYSKEFNWSNLEQLAASSITQGDLLQKEFFDLVVKARKIYPSHRKSKLARTQ